MPLESKHPEPIVLHAGYRSDSATNAVAVYQTTSYQCRQAEHAANLFALKELDNIYTRIMNPACAVLEERLAALEGSAATLALCSGQAASAFAIHPAMTTHSQLSPEEQLATGMSDGYVHLSLGLEHIGDLTANPDQALVKATGSKRAAE